MGACTVAVGQFEARASEYSGVRIQNQPTACRTAGAGSGGDLENSFRRGKGDYVLSTTEGEKPIRGIAKFYQTRLPSAILTKHGAVLSAPFTSHDLRSYIPFFTMSSRVTKPLILRPVQSRSEE